MSKRILCPKCGQKPDVQEIHFDNMLLGIWCKDCGSVPMEIKLDSPKTDYVIQERRKVESKKRNREKRSRISPLKGIKLTDLPLAIRKKLGYPAS